MKDNCLNSISSQKFIIISTDPQPFLIYDLQCLQKDIFPMSVQFVDEYSGMIIRLIMFHSARCITQLYSLFYLVPPPPLPRCQFIWSVMIINLK